MKAGGDYLNVSIYKKDIYNHEVFTFFPALFDLACSLRAGEQLPAIAIHPNLSFTLKADKKRVGFSSKKHFIHLSLIFLGENS